MNEIISFASVRISLKEMLNERGQKESLGHDFINVNFKTGETIYQNIKKSEY